MAMPRLTALIWFDLFTLCPLLCLPSNAMPARMTDADASLKVNALLSLKRLRLSGLGIGNMDGLEVSLC